MDVADRTEITYNGKEVEEVFIYEYLRRVFINDGKIEIELSKRAKKSAKNTKQYIILFYERQK